MRGSIISQTPGSYTLIVSYKDDFGKRKQKWKTVHCGYKEAQRKLRELVNQVESGLINFDSQKLTVSKYLTQWLDYVKINSSGKTHEVYTYLINKHIIPVIGSIQLAQLKAQHLNKLYADKLDRLSPATVKKIHFILHRALRYATENNMIVRNPMDAGIESPKVDKHENNTMDLKVIESFALVARKTEYYLLFMLIIFTGMRRGEALALRWTDIDFDGVQLFVNRTLKFDHGKISYGPPKTGKGRSISLTKAWLAALARHKAEQIAVRKMIGLKGANELVFCHIDGSPYLPSTVTHAWIKLRNKLGIKTRLHDGRHTMATLLLMEGVHPKIVQERLGHASIKTTLDTYSHVIPGMQEAAAIKLDNLVSKALVKPETEISEG